MINERKLAFKYLCKKKRRSITTLFAIIIAVFLIFVSGNLILSAYYAFQQLNLKAYGDYVAYLIHKFLYNLQKYLPKRVVFVVS